MLHKLFDKLTSNEVVNIEEFAPYKKQLYVLLTNYYGSKEDIYIIYTSSYGTSFFIPDCEPYDYFAKTYYTDNESCDFDDYICDNISLFLSTISNLCNHLE